MEIKNRWTGIAILSGEYASVKACLEQNPRAGLSGADLSKANLSGANLYEADLHGVDLYGANLHEANLRGASLYKANLARADLSGADLSGADLSRANLYKADLSGANLSGASLSGAIGVNKYLTTPLQLLRDQPGKIRAYKLVTQEGDSPMCRQNGAQPINYRIGAAYEVQGANKNELAECGPGINLATLDWCLREWREGFRILVAEFEAADIAAIPIASDGKFRVTRCTIVGEKTLEELGWPPAKTHREAS